MQWLSKSLTSRGATPSRMSCIASCGKPPPNMVKNLISRRIERLLMLYVFEKCEAVGPLSIEHWLLWLCGSDFIVIRYIMTRKCIPSC